MAMEEEGVYTTWYHSTSKGPGNFRMLASCWAVDRQLLVVGALPVVNEKEI